MTDPVFETWADVEAWAKCRRYTGLLLISVGCETDGRRRIEAASRVIAAHSHLREIR